MTNYKGHLVQAIKVDGIPAGTKGTIKDMEYDGKFIVAWENGKIGVIRERGDTYKLIDVSQKSFWNFKNILSFLRNKLKQIYNPNPNNSSVISQSLILERAEEEQSLKPDGIDGNVDGYDGAIVGITRDGQLVYSIEKMIEICARDGKMEEIDAIEWLEYNTFCAYVGEKTPLYIYTSTGY